MSELSRKHFALYRTKSTEELLQLLESGSTAQRYRVMVVLQSHRLDYNAFDLLKEINDSDPTIKNRKMASILLHRFFPKESKGIKPGESKVIGYVYFIENQISGEIKIGRTKNLRKRMNRFTDAYSFPFKLIQYIYSLNYERIELAFHVHFDKKRKHGEWFLLDTADIEQILQREFPKEIKSLIINEEL